MLAFVPPDEIMPTFGTCLFNNMKMKDFLKNNIIGYCPQFDAVDEYLSGREALYIYAKLIGITEIEQAIMSAITRFKLQSFINIPIIKYSGGMKRVLSVAVSMLGDPQVILLDEPTNAMVRITLFRSQIFLFDRNINTRF